MNKHIKAYTHEMLKDFMRYLITFEQVGDKGMWSLEILSTVVEDGRDWRVHRITDEEIEELIDIFLRDKR